MTLADLLESLPGSVLAGRANLDREVTGGYVGDLLSQVMAKARHGNLWVTVQAHPNIVAVAVVAGLSGVIITEGVSLDPNAINKAEEEGIPLFSTTFSSYDVVAALVEAGLNRSQVGSP